MDFHVEASTLVKSPTGGSRDVYVRDHVNITKDLVADYDAAKAELVAFYSSVAENLFEDAVLARLGGTAYEAFKNPTAATAAVEAPVATEAPVVEAPAEVPVAEVPAAEVAAETPAEEAAPTEEADTTPTS